MAGSTKVQTFTSTGSARTAKITGLQAGKAYTVSIYGYMSKAGKTVTTNTKSVSFTTVAATSMKKTVPSVTPKPSATTPKPVSPTPTSTVAPTPTPTPTPTSTVTR